MGPGRKGIVSEPNRRYQFKCCRLLLSRFLEGVLYSPFCVAFSLLDCVDVSDLCILYCGLVGIKYLLLFFTFDINIRNDCMQYMTRIQEKRFLSAVACWTDWLNVCVRVWPMTGAVNYYEKALKILFWSPILRPLSPAPGDNCPLFPPTLCHWA